MTDKRTSQVAERQLAKVSTFSADEVLNTVRVQKTQVKILGRQSIAARYVQKSGGWPEQFVFKFKEIFGR